MLCAIVARMGISSTAPKREKTRAMVNRGVAVNHEIAHGNWKFLEEFPDDKACLDYLMQLRFGTLITCPKCKRTGKFHKIRKIPAYACQWCGYHLHPMAQTRFTRSRIGLRVWFHAVYLFSRTHNGMAAKELQRKLNITYKSAWRMRNTIIDAKYNLVGAGTTSPQADFESLLGALILPQASTPARGGKNKSA